MKNINQLIEEVQNNPEFRAKFVGLDEAGLDKMLKDEGYDVTMEEVAEAAKDIDIELTPEELEKIAGGKNKVAWGVSTGTTILITTIGTTFVCTIVDMTMN